MVTLICRAIYEIVFFSLGAFEFSLTAAYMRGQQVQEAELTELSPAYMEEYVQCSSGPVPRFQCLGHLDLVEEGKDQDEPCSALPQ